MTTATDYDAAVREIVPDLEYRAEFVPQSKSRNAGDKTPSLNWRVTFSRNGRELATDYMQGIGHLPGTDSWAVNQGRKTVAQDTYERHCAEDGRYCPTRPYELPTSPIPAPSIADVLHCLLMDAEAIDAGSFEEWASNYGYDTDSRKAEVIYRACLDTGLKLRAMLGDEIVSRLREQLQDI